MNLESLRLSYDSAALYPVLVAALLLIAASIDCRRTAAPKRLYPFVYSACVLLVVALALGISSAPAASDHQAIGPARETNIDKLYDLKAEIYAPALLAQPRYQQPARLTRHEARVFSQGGEDGIIAEIFRRIGTTNRRFVEFGSSSGAENNTVWLLRNGWGGLWIDADSAAIAKARSVFAGEIWIRRLTVVESFVTAENIENIFGAQGVPHIPDLLSIDIDGNDYWVWRAIERYRPRAVVIEYNSAFPPDRDFVYPYRPDAQWDGTSHYGASLKALELLGRKKGYSLVGCNLGGVNAFFVDAPLAKGKFAEPFTAENHYEPRRVYVPAWRAAD